VVTAFNMLFDGSSTHQVCTGSGASVRRRKRVSSFRFRHAPQKLNSFKTMSCSPALAIARLAALALLCAALVSASTLHSSSELSESAAAHASELPISLGPGDYVFTLNRPEGPRTFRVRVPKSYAPAAPTPLLLAFHGLNDHCDKFDLKTGFLQLADQYGFLLVYPCSETGALGTAWNGTSFWRLTHYPTIHFSGSFI
jgi:poly(3-hydroxybutyrate) depolymerase